MVDVAIRVALMLILFNINSSLCYADAYFPQKCLLDYPPHSRQYHRQHPESQHVDSTNVQLRGVHIKSTVEDSPNLIFFPEAFDEAESWLNFFANPHNKVLYLVSR